jgi:hypothetical protein
LIVSGKSSFWRSGVKSSGSALPSGYLLKEIAEERRDLRLLVRDCGLGRRHERAVVEAGHVM